MATLRPLVRVVFERTGISKSGSKTRSTTARFDPDVNLDELRGESGVTVTNIEARESPSPERTPNGGKRRRRSSGGESGNSESGWQSFGSQEHVLQSNTRIKRSVQVTIHTSDAADVNETQSVRSPMGVKRVL